MDTAVTTANRRSISIENWCTFLLIFLFVYSASSKLLTFEKFSAQMHVQAIPGWSVGILVWAVPISELLIALLLLLPKWRYLGMWSAAVLMTVFTVYVGLVIIGTFDHVPCSCGGVLQSMGWHLHLVFNLFFLLLSILGIYTINRERSVIGNE